MAFVQKFKISANGNVAYSIGKVCGNLRLRPLTRGGGPHSLTFESVDARHLLPGRRSSRRLARLKRQAAG